ncbi:hypothetical protein BH20ACT24_BH20ACT24_10350 [soil metagenome]
MRTRAALVSGALVPILVALLLGPAPARGEGERGLPDLTVTKLEVTQAIQYLDNPNEPDNSITLIRGRRTIVRMYVGVSGSSEPVDGVDGSLNVFVNGIEMAGSPFGSINGPISAPLIPDREETDHTLNFKFVVSESGLPFGTADVDLIAEVNPDHVVEESDFTNNTLAENDLGFECRRSPTMAYLPVDYLGDLPSQSLMAPGIGNDFMWHTYPIPEPPSYYLGGPAVDWDIDIDASGGDLINELDARRALMSPMPDLIYGWLPGNPYNGNGLATVGGTAAFGNTQTSPNRYQRTFSHEVTHMFGLGHNARDLAPEVGFDIGWPPSEVVDTDNCDVAGTQGTKCGALKDIMYPGLLTPNAWIDAQTYTYLAGHDLLQSTCPGIIFPPEGLIEFEVLKGKVPNCEVIDCGPCQPGPPCNWHIDPLIKVIGPAELSRPDPGGMYGFQFLDREENVLFDTTFDVSFEGDEERLETAAFSLFVPPFDDARFAILLHEGREVLRLTRSPSVPIVEILSPKPGGTLRGEVTVDWEASDRDDDPLLFSLQYSPDNGETFVSLAADLQLGGPDTKFVGDTSQIPGTDGPTGLLRLITTDGMNSILTDVRALNVPADKAPLVSIVEPAEPGAIDLPMGVPLILVGYGYDLEEGFLVKRALTWSSSIDGKLGNGRMLQAIELSPGRHVIKLTGRDSDGNVVRDKVVVNVVGLAPEPADQKEVGSR